MAPNRNPQCRCWEGHARTQSKRTRMTRGHKVRAAACAFAAVAMLALALGAAASAAPVNLLEPPGKRAWSGAPDTGDMADFGQFADVVDKHPALIQSFRNWGSDF